MSGRRGGRRRYDHAASRPIAPGEALLAAKVVGEGLANRSGTGNAPVAVMRWTNNGTSNDVEDRRGGGGFVKLGIGGTLIVGALSLFFGRNLFTSLGVEPGTGQPSAEKQAPAPNTKPDTQAAFVSFVLDDVQNTWTKELPRRGVQYERAKLVLFSDRVQSACGAAGAAVGPFYCPADQRVYLDLTFFDELKNRFGAPGDFAQAYVIAHEVGHHVQNVMGTEAKVRKAQKADRSSANDLSVRLELQADCYAGVWGHSTSQRKILEAGDMEEGLAAAASVGDDRLQKKGSGEARTETFTHGSSRQRMSWFKKGFDSGDPAACDTFGSGVL